ncbi:MAG: L-fucose/L-arabinose isomerase family protein [Candidatus Omnitrophica bacterium]|nr:L-fucose/L-arabinose isomerase family protein [Candidatus Omnitrophota bacterium]
MSKPVLAVIVGNRNLFPDRLIQEGRRDILDVLKELDIEPVILKEDETNMGSVETWAHAKQCAELFDANRDRIDGILVTLPNFGDERAVADTVKLSGLKVPILVQAYPDKLDELAIDLRRDSFCGKISVCSNLRQYGFPFSLTSQHTVEPKSESFKHDLKKFVRVCQTVKGLKNARLGAVGARPNAFTTVRYSEKILQENGISVSTIDLSEVFGMTQKLADHDDRVQAQLKEIQDYAHAGSVPQAPMVKMAKLAVVLLDWMQENDLDATAIQCWSSIQENYGVNACAIMSLMSEKLMPSACEMDVTGVVSMYAAQLASGIPSALVDWNNNYADDPDKCVLFHCGNWAKTYLSDMKLQTSDILEMSFGKENTFGALAGRTAAGPATFARVTTDDGCGVLRAYVTEGRFTDDPLDTFGSKAVVEVPGLQTLLKYICQLGFEHHVAVNASHCASILAEAFENYLRWDVYYHNLCDDECDCGCDCGC